MLRILLQLDFIFFVCGCFYIASDLSVSILASHSGARNLSQSKLSVICVRTEYRRFIGASMKVPNLPYRTKSCDLSGCWHSCLVSSRLGVCRAVVIEEIGHQLRVVIQCFSMLISPKNPCDCKRDLFSLLFAFTSSSDDMSTAVEAHLLNQSVRVP